MVSMLDVLQEDAALEDEANAVLGGSDDKQCTYNQVIKNQLFRRNWETRM